jgi:TetR/AcrR family transcriptional repressor of nem operon
VRAAFTEELKAGLEFLAGLMPGDDPVHRYEDAIAAFASMAGALMLARAVTDEPLSEQILHTTTKRMIPHATVRGPARRTKGMR